MTMAAEAKKTRKNRNGPLYAVPLAFLLLLTLLYLRNRTKTEEEALSPPQNGLTPELTLAPGAIQAAGIRSIPLPPEALSQPIQLPRRSLLWDLGMTSVYLRVGKNRFARIRVVPESPSEGGRWRLVGRLPKTREPLELVTEGAQMLLSDELKTEIQVED